MHSIDALRSLQKEVYLAPYEAKWKVFIIHDADRMLPTSANALLKTFEEPYKTSVIILLSSKPENLPTLLSRCRRWHFNSLFSLTSLDPTLMQLLSQGSFRSYQEMKEKIVKWCELFENKEEEGSKEALGDRAIKYRSEVLHFLRVIYAWYRDLHLHAVKGNKERILLKGYEEEEVQALQRGELKPLDEVEKYLSEAMLSIERFTPLSHVLESLFLKLGWI